MMRQGEVFKCVCSAILAAFDDTAARLRFARRLVRSLMSDGRKVLPAKVILPFQLHRLAQMEKDLEGMRKDMQKRLAALKHLGSTRKPKR